MLIVPNRSIPTLNDATEADEALLGHMLLTARIMAEKQGIAETGYRLAFNTNEDAGQSAFHLASDKTEISEGKTFYKISDEPTLFAGTSMYSDGSIYPAEAIFDGTAFTEKWNTTAPPTKMIWRFMDDVTLECTYYSMNEKGEWEILYGNILHKI